MHCTSNPSAGGLDKAVRDDYRSLASYKMSIVACDMDIIKLPKHPHEAIKGLYFNAWQLLIQILSACFTTIKAVALDAVQARQVVANEEEVKECNDLRALFKCLSVKEKWDDLRFLDLAISCLPSEAAKEMEAARLVLGHYRSHLVAYVKAMSIKEGKKVFGGNPYQLGSDNKWAVTEVTVHEDIEAYTCQDCLNLWKWFLIKALEIPEDCILFCVAKPGNSTTLVFMVLQTLVRGIEEKLSLPGVLWVMKELHILQVKVPGIFAVKTREILQKVPTAAIGMDWSVELIFCH